MTFNRDCIFSYHQLNSSLKSTIHTFLSQQSIPIVKQSQISFSKHTIQRLHLGKLQQEQALKLRQLVVEKQASFVFQEQSMTLENAGLAVFDADKTILDCEVIDLLASISPHKEKIEQLTEQAMQGDLDFQSAFQQRVALLSGVSVHKLETVFSQILFTNGVLSLLQKLKKSGWKIGVISGGFRPIIQRKFSEAGIHFDFIFAHELAEQNGKLTGVVETNATVDHEKKGFFLEQQMRQFGIPSNRTLALGDGYNDRMMLRKAGVGCGFRAKPKLLAELWSNIFIDDIELIIPLLGWE